jgi:hypothetical protein
VVEVQDGNKNHVATDPMELWRQWNETTSKLWLQAMENSKETAKGTAVDPYSLYRSWIKNVNSIQEQTKSIPFAMNPREMWNTWFSATMEIWKKSAELGGDPLGLSTQWLKLMEKAQAQLLAGETLPADPFTFFRNWYNATNEQWSKTVEEALGSEKFLAYSAPFLESYTSLTKTFRKASEEYFKQLQLPTVSDIARVAELVIDLEEKIDQIADTFDTLEAKQEKAATADRVKGIEQRLDYLATADTVAGLEKRLGHVATTAAVEKLETRIDNLAKMSLENMTTVTKVGNLEKRLDKVEGKLDKVLTLLEKIQATETSQRKTPKKNVAHQEAPEANLEG